MSAFHWTCPYCQRDTTIGTNGTSAQTHFFNNGNKEGWLAIVTEVVVCPNPACKEYAISGALYSAVFQYGQNHIPKESKNSPLKIWNLRPQSSSQPLPEYVPKPIVGDYQEACLIKSLSPKASATLARRCLQGVIRDFWGISEGRLIDEIIAIKDKTDPLTWQAIDSVRKIGNIGAHMEKDINLIIEVDENEAGMLLSLIEILIKDWYVARHEREVRLSGIVGIASEKEAAKKSSLTEAEKN
jgi:hypothetical protein